MAAVDDIKRALQGAQGLADPAAPSSAADAQNGIGSPPITPDEADLAKFSSITTLDDMQWAANVRQMFQQARSARRPRVMQWMKNYALMTPRTWGSGRPSWMPSPEIPEVASVVMSHVAWMTDQRPDVHVTPASTPNSPYSEFLSTLAADLQVVMQANFIQEQFDAQVEMACSDMHIYGVGIFKTSWDALAVGGMGNAVMKRIDPFTFYLDPKASGLDDAAYMVEVKTMSLSMLARRFGTEVAGKIAPHAYIEDSDRSPSLTSAAGVNGSMPMAMPGTITTGLPAYGLPGQTDRARAQDDPGVTILEAWIREQEEIDIDGDVYRYDSWRCVIVCGQQVLFNQRAIDMWLHTDHPYSAFTPMATGEFYGVSTVELLSSMQLSINRILGAIEHNIWLIGNPILKETRRSGVTRQTMSNQPGRRLEVNSIDDAKWMEPPQMHPQMSMQVVEFYISRMEAISGLSAQNRGMAPRGRNSTEALDSVSEGSFVRVRMGLRNLERALRTSLNQVAAMVTEFYDTPRMLAVIGPDGEKTAKALRSRHFYVPSYDHDEPASPLRFMLNVGAGSSLPTSRLGRAQEADVLYAMGALDIQGVLDAHEWPGRSEIIKRVNAQRAQGIEPPGARQRTQRTQ